MRTDSILSATRHTFYMLVSLKSRSTAAGVEALRCAGGTIELATGLGIEYGVVLLLV